MDDTADPTVQTGADDARDQARLDPPRVVRLDSLTPPERELVLALIEAARTRAAIPTVENPGDVGLDDQPA